MIRVGIIGGADGPTAIMLVGTIGAGSISIESSESTIKSSGKLTPVFVV